MASSTPAPVTSTPESIDGAVDDTTSDTTNDTTNDTPEQRSDGLDVGTPISMSDENDETSTASLPLEPKEVDTTEDDCYTRVQQSRVKKTKTRFIEQSMIDNVRISPALASSISDWDPSGLVLPKKDPIEYKLGTIGHVTKNRKLYASSDYYEALQLKNYGYDLNSPTEIKPKGCCIVS